MRKTAIAQLAARLKIDARTSDAAAALHRAMTRIAAAADAFDARSSELRADPQWSDVGRRRQLEDLYRRQSDSLRFGEAAVESAKSHINTRRAAAKPKHDPADLVGELRRQEMRSYVRSLPPGERVAAAFANPAIAEAVADALPALSGLTAEQATHVQDHVLGSHPEAAELAEVEEAASAVNSATIMLRDLMREHLGGELPAQAA